MLESMPTMQTPDPGFQAQIFNENAKLHLNRLNGGLLSLEAPIPVARVRSIAGTSVNP
jgi:hypothetical protein